MKNNRTLMSRIILVVLLITLLVVFTGCSNSDDALGISVIGLLISIGALLSSVLEAIVSALGLAVSGVASIVILFVKLIEFIVSLF